MQKGRQCLCIHAGARISPTARCVGPSPTTRGRSPPAACSQLTSPPGTVWSYPRGIALNHRETVGRFQYHTGGGRCPDVNISMSSPGTLSISGGPPPYLREYGEECSFQPHTTTGNQQVCAIAFCHIHMQQIARFICASISPPSSVKLVPSAETTSPLSADPPG